MFKQVKIGLCVVALALLASSTWAAPPPATSLSNCQNAVKTATRQFVSGEMAAIGGCLQAVSSQIVKNDAANASGAAALCVSSFRKLNDSRGLAAQLSDKLAAAISKKCAPGQPGVTHTLADILGSGAGVAQPLYATNLNAWCSHFGGDGSLDSVGEWIACITAASECEVDSSIAAQFPRVLEWLGLAQTAMQSFSPPASDATKVSDAIAALTALHLKLDPFDEDVVRVQCGQSCGNNLSEGAEVCDGADLNGQTCATQTPATPYGTLACNAGCAAFDSTACVGRFVDNGDGSVADNQTKLLWEKKDNVCPGIHCSTDGSYTWSTGTDLPDGTAFTVFLATLNGGASLGASADATTCSDSFAGHCDWRLPTIAELRSILLAPYPCGTSPCIDPAFGPTVPSFFWAATTDSTDPGRAWDVRFSNGSVQAFDNTSADYVRAVRGVCSSPTCLASGPSVVSCSDGIQNGDESAVDCGGLTCAARCAFHQPCLINGDCQSDSCVANFCGL